METSEINLEKQPEFEMSPITNGDLLALATLHKAVFPEPLISRLGKEMVAKHFAWQIRKAKTFMALGAWRDDKLAGFAVGGVIKPGLRQFYREHLWQIVGTLILNPVRIFDPAMLKIAFRSLGRRNEKRVSLNPKTETPIPGPDSFHFMYMAVDPKLRRRGLGRQLITELERRASERRFLKAHLEVDVDNATAIRLYHSLGYRIIGQTQNPAGKQQFIMDKMLDRRAAS